ncbi:hypothetical protein BU15DRAFT_73719 [Melanogaster broomeanus]|nr:hypothetical protein BU15DRAFT_73719 [Melanogaster broomeanus]
MQRCPTPTIEWLRTTFPTRERAIELLRPELEAGELTRRDYELATRFFPGPSYGIRCGLQCGHIKRNFGTVGGFALGATYGILRSLPGTPPIRDALEDPDRFMTALNHVDRRLGGSGEAAFGIRSDAQHTPGPEMVREEDWSQQQHDTDASGNVSKPPETSPASKWEDIRNANARNVGRQTSWDVLRQRHERSKLPNSTSSPDGSPAGNTDERTAAQARFDALLEAERRKGKSQDG